MIRILSSLIPDTGGQSWSQSAVHQSASINSASMNTSEIQLSEAGVGGAGNGGGVKIETGRDRGVGM